ncbi:MAG: OmpH family outer membrane protein [bacterium]|nr:OmpH family outer membrane protein [bacterium]
MSHIKKQISFVVVALLLTPVFLSAAQKIGVVNMEKLFTNYYKTKLADAKIKNQTEIYRKYLASLNDSKNKLQQEFVEMRDASQNIAYSDIERENKRIEAQNKYRQLQAKNAEIQQYNEQKKQQLFGEYEKIRDKLVSEIGVVVKNIAKREKFTIIYDNSGNTMNNIPVVVYNDPNIDITAKVSKELNLGNENINP